MEVLSVSYIMVVVLVFYFTVVSIQSALLFVVTGRGSSTNATNACTQSIDVINVTTRICHSTLSTVAMHGQFQTFSTKKHTVVCTPSDVCLHV